MIACDWLSSFAYASITLEQCFTKRGEQEAMLRWLRATGLFLLAFGIGQALANEPIEVMSAEQALVESQSGERVLIDVRSPSEWRETGIPETAEAVTIHDPRGLPAFVQEVIDRTGGDRERPVAFICATGVRSAYATQLLRDAGYQDVVNVKEGMFGSDAGSGWREKGLPIAECQNC